MVLGDHFPAIFHASSFHLPVSALPLWFWAIMFLSFPFHFPFFLPPACLSPSSVALGHHVPFIPLSFSILLPSTCLSQPFLCGSGPACSFHFPFLFHSSSFHLLVSALPLWLWAIMFLSFPFHLPVYNLPGVPNLADYFDPSDAVTT